MLKIDKINVNITDNQINLGNTRLEFTISGNNIDYIVVNTLRRTIMSDIPIYAFKEFIFNKNTSVFHNNYLKLRINNLPVWGIENNIDFLSENLNKNNENMNIIEEDEDIDIDNDMVENKKSSEYSSLKELTMYINFKNKQNNIITVTTDQAKFYYEEKQIPSPYKVPIPIVKLHPNQEISFSSISKIGNEKESVIHSAVSVAAYKQVNDNEFNFFLESRGQINEKRIIIVAILNIERKMKELIKSLKTKEINNDNLQGVLIINNENHTLGNLISRGLQQHNNINFAGYKLPHPLENIVHIHYSMKKKENIINIITDVINYYNEIFSKIKKYFIN